MIQSTPWTKAELAELSAIIQKAKQVSLRKKERGINSKKNTLLNSYFK